VLNPAKRQQITGVSSSPRPSCRANKKQLAHLTFDGKRVMWSRRLTQQPRLHCSMKFPDWQEVLAYTPTSVIYCIHRQPSLSLTGIRDWMHLPTHQPGQASTALIATLHRIHAGHIPQIWAPASLVKLAHPQATCSSGLANRAVKTEKDRKGRQCYPK